MAVTKAHDEFHALDLETGWEVLVGYPVGIQQKVLSGALDEINKKGSRTRLLRFEPGVFTTKPFVHDYWEEVFLITGDLVVGNDKNGQGGTSFGRLRTPVGRPARLMVLFDLIRGVCSTRLIITIRRSGAGEITECVSCVMGGFR